MPALLPAPDRRTADLPEREAILDPILSKKSLTMVYGPRGLGKTHVALGIAWAAASGQSFLKWTATRRHRVVYVDGEMAAVDLQARLRQFGAAPPDLDFLIADLNPTTVMADLNGTAGQTSLMRAWGRQPELLVLDNLSSLMGLRGNNADRWGEVQHWLAVMRRAGMAVLMLHHANKDGDQRGTSQREDALDVVMSMRPPSDHTPQQGARFELHFEKARGLYGDAVEPIEAWVETDIVGAQRWKWQPLEQSEFDRAVRLLRQGIPPLGVMRELGLSRSAIYRMREKAIAKGLLDAPARSEPKDLP
jgi:hypothetical protein